MAQVGPLLDRYNDCVLTVSLGIAGDRRIAAEKSFAACATEEQAIRAYMALADMPFANIDAAMIRRKLALKRVILQDPN